MPKVYYAAKAVYEKVSRGRLDAIRRLMPAGRPLVVLDVGCGGGTLGKALKSDSQVTVFGVDVAPQAVEMAKNNLDDAWVADIELSDPWPTEVVARRYDLIIISEVLEHLFFPEQLLRAVRPLLVEDGVIIVTIPNVLFWKNRLRLMIGHFTYEDSGLMDRGHVHFFSWESLNDLLRQNDFYIEACAHVVPTRLFRPFANLVPGLVARQFAVKIRPV